MTWVVSKAAFSGQKRKNIEKHLRRGNGRFWRSTGVLPVFPQLHELTVIGIDKVNTAGNAFTNFVRCCHTFI